MNRKIRNRLVAAGHALAPPADEPPVKTFFAWSTEDVLGLDSEEYRRAFWREFNRPGHSTGRTRRTLESWQRERGDHTTEFYNASFDGERGCGGVGAELGCVQALY